MPFFLLPLLTGALGSVASAGAAVAAGAASAVGTAAGAVGTVAASAAGVAGTTAGGITAAASSGAAAIGSAASSAIATAGSVASSLATARGTAEGVIAGAATAFESAVATQAAALVKAVPALDSGLKAAKATQVMNARVIATAAARQKRAMASIAQSLGGSAAAQGAANVVAPVVGYAHAVQFAAKTGMTAASKIAGGQLTAPAVGQMAGSVVSMKNVASNLNRQNVRAAVDDGIDRFSGTCLAELPTEQFLDIVYEPVSELVANIAKSGSSNVVQAFDAKLTDTVSGKRADVPMHERTVSFDILLDKLGSVEGKLGATSVEGKMAIHMLLAVAAVALAKSKSKT
jgi:hypothetical protein